MQTFAKIKIAAVALAAPMLAMAAPASAATPAHIAPVQAIGSTAFDVAGPMQTSVIVERNRGKHRGWERGRGNPHRYDNRYSRRSAYNGERVYRSTRVWRDRRDGRYYCRKQDGTTGLLIGAGVGALIGNELAGRGDRTLGAIIGAAGGALLGREIDRGGTRCR